MMNKSNKILITRPEHDPGTRYLSQWSKQIIELAQDKNIQVIDLHEEKATKKEVEGRILKTEPSFVILNGHGNEDCVTGHNNEVLVKKGENEEILKGRITYAVSCDSAEKLGRACADKDTAYIGYLKNFNFNFSRKCLSRPLTDKRAERFLVASNQVAFSLIKGHTAKESSERSKESFKRAIRSLLTSEHANDPDITEDIKGLWWDMQHQVCLGAGEKRI
jgi:hypothetical protein